MTHRIDREKVVSEAMHRFLYEPMFHGRVYATLRELRMLRMPADDQTVIVTLHLSDLADRPGFTYKP